MLMAWKRRVAGGLVGLLVATPAQSGDLSRLSPGARAMVERAFADLRGAEVVDHHVHVLGLGAGGTGASVDPALLSWRHPLDRLKAKIFFAASGIAEEEIADRQYVERLRDLADGFPVPVRLAALAFDRRYAADGRPAEAAGEFHTPDAYVLDLARRHRGTFVPVVSIHPHAADALERLRAAADDGARMVKWLPNAQGMDPSDPALDPFYREMARLGMILLCHTGHESSVKSPDGQRLGNPLLLRRPLDLGVKVVMAHAGNRGRSEDLDNPGRSASNFELFLRMMDDPRYQGRLFADISALTQTLRDSGDIVALLARSDLHGRLVNGSDYPLPAIGPFIGTARLAWGGLVTWEECRRLNEIHRANPLLFDFVLKRALRHPETGARFPARMFTAHPDIDLGPFAGIPPLSRT